MKKFYIFLILTGMYSFAFAQVRDAQLWIGPVVKYNISDKFRLDFEQQFRFNENISNYDFTFSEIGIRYEVFKFMDLKASYRHSFIPAGESGSAITDNDKSRISLDVSTGTEIFNTRVKVSYRFRFQDSWENKSLDMSKYIRNRFGIDYNLSKLADPYADWESYYRLDGKNEFRQNRYTFGLTWKITGKLDIDSYYRIQKEINVKNPETDFIIGLAVIYSIN